MKRDKNNWNEGHYRALLKKDRFQPDHIDLSHEKIICSFLLSLSEETQTHSALYDTLWTKVTIYNISLMLLHGTHLKEPHRRLNISWVYRDVLQDVRSKASRTQYICALGAFTSQVYYRLLISMSSLCQPPKFIISRWHWQETVFLHNILWSIAHMCTVTWLLSTLTICLPQYNSWAFYSLLLFQITLTPLAVWKNIQRAIELSLMKATFSAQIPQRSNFNRWPHCVWK